ncbi:Hypothetical predicted protein, partial [Pelobates cultripes]
DLIPVPWIDMGKQAKRLKAIAGEGSRDIDDLLKYGLNLKWRHSLIPARLPQRKKLWMFLTKLHTQGALTLHYLTAPVSKGDFKVL